MKLFYFQILFFIWIVYSAWTCCVISFVFSLACPSYVSCNRWRYIYL